MEGHVTGIYRALHCLNIRASSLARCQPAEIYKNGKADLSQQGAQPFCQFKGDSKLFSLIGQYWNSSRKQDYQDGFF